MDYYMPENPSTPDVSLISAEELRRGRIHSARRGISRLFIALSVFFAITYAIIYAAAIALAMLGPDTYEKYAEDATFNLLLSSVSMYLIAFPIFFLIIFKMPKGVRERSKLSFGDFLIALCISEAVMQIGNVIGVVLMGIIEAFAGESIPNGTIELVSELPTELMLLVAVVIGPIVEELMFRRLLIDRLSVHGDMFAIIVSAVAFGIFHQNIYQLFYATLLGAVLGFVYVKTRRIIYPILLHVTINFIGSYVALFVQDCLNRLLEISEQIMASENPSFDLVLEMIVPALVLIAYSTVIYGMIAVGVVFFIIKLKKRKLSVSRECPRPLDRGGLVKATLTSVGVIIYLAFSMILTLSSIITPLITQ